MSLATKLYLFALLLVGVAMILNPEAAAVGLFLLFLIAIFDDRNGIRMEERTICDQCGGNGYIYYGVGREFDCDACQGKGYWE